MIAPPLLQSFLVCPHCKRPLVPIYAQSAIQYWECVEHGEVTPMNSAVVNYYGFSAGANA